MTATDTPTVQTTIGQLVAQRPARSRVFEKLGIDYCCGGQKTLAQVCSEKKMDPGLVLDVLLATEAASPQEDNNWTNASLTSLADHIEKTHHAYLKKELPRLSAIVQKVAAVHGQRHPWLQEVNTIYAQFAAEMESHMMKEEKMLFPMIRHLESLQPGEDSGRSLDSPIKAMEHEHDDAGKAMARMRELSSNYQMPADGCNTFHAMLDGLAQVEADTHRHVHKENSILFPRAVELQERGLAS
jgi:regulator of cell morphogenesis and NO signaling